MNRFINRYQRAGAWIVKRSYVMLQHGHVSCFVHYYWYDDNDFATLLRIMLPINDETMDNALHSAMHHNAMLFIVILHGICSAKGPLLASSLIEPR